MDSSETPAPLKLGTFIGVFTPTILTILGVIMYLRLGWVVGHAGMTRTVIIVLVANAITAITALSMSALATNMRVGVGGAYFLISRSLGLETGGAIGIPLYLSQTLSLTLYAYGLAESVKIVWAGAPISFLAAVIVVGVASVAARSTELALKLQLPIMGLILLSLASLVAGVDWGSRPLPTGSGELGFWPVFAVFFPAVTGVLAGVSLSGDLDKPEESIPRGTLAAVFVGAIVYFTVPFFLAYGAPPEALIANELVWTEIAAVPLFVMLGLWGAVLSSAFGSILGAPRTLQALARDRLAPEWLGRNDPATGEPLAALYLSAVIAFVAVLLGDLNAVAEWVTVFFLTTYGALNAVAALEGLVGDISFRPRIPVPWWVSALGGFGCLVAMLLINPLACGIAIVVELIIFWWLSRRSLEATWGDVRSGFWQYATRFSLLKLRESGHDPRNWRPHLLVFAKDLSRDVDMVRLAGAFSQERGIVTVTTLRIGDIDEHVDTDVLLRRNEAILEREGVLAFSEVAAVPQLAPGIITVAQAHGFAGLASNSVLLGWPKQPTAERLSRQMGLVRRLNGLHKSTLIFRPGDREPREDGPLLIWWKGKESNGDLMLLLAHLLSLDPLYANNRIVLKSVVEDEEAAVKRQREFALMLPDIRIQAHVDVIVRPEDESALSVIRRQSVGARLVFLGLSVVSEEDGAVYGERLVDMLDGLTDTLLVRNAGPFRGMLVG
ncbi:MAG: Na-K-Cl cotransporter [Deltaproteobacteria bacterium]|nr:MAG: Na-K-Cl cotransporter [Deltaproteobacteria bacterium]